MPFLKKSLISYKPIDSFPFFEFHSCKFVNVCLNEIEFCKKKKKNPIKFVNNKVCLDEIEFRTKKLIKYLEKYSLVAIVSVIKEEIKVKYGQNTS